MNALFTINFRREAYIQEVARRRRHVIALGAWVAYFGLIAIVLGLYGLNCSALAKRSAQLERQTTQIRRNGASPLTNQLEPGDLALVESYVSNPRRWRDRLARIGGLMPPEARLTGVAINPRNLSDAASQNVLMISGEIRNAPGSDRMQGVMKIVAALREDSTFRIGYQNIRLASTNVSEDGNANFEIECR